MNLSIGIVCAPFKSLDNIFTFLDAFRKMENEGDEMQGRLYFSEAYLQQHCCKMAEYYPSFFFVWPKRKRLDSLYFPWC